ncbi:hypothetical protein KAS50_09740, partial [bacterium]|nr:hypothetical protein [bacterium]
MKKITRREVLKKLTAGVSTAAVFPNMSLGNGNYSFASSPFAAKSAQRDKPLILAAFVRPDVERYWLGWPGTSYDIPGHQQQYTKILKEAAKKLGANLELIEKPLHDSNTVNAFLENLEASKPDGIIITAMSLNKPAWPHINQIAKNRGNIPTVIFSPMGTSFTQHLQETRNISGVYVGATQDLSWLSYSMQMLNTIWQMKNTRLCILRGNETEDRIVDVYGTTLHYIPRSRFPEEFKKTETTNEMKSIADYYEALAEKTVEPNRQDMINAAKNYIVARRIMAEENCQGISMDCLGLVREHLIPCPPCLAWTRLNDEGSVGACEAAWMSAVLLRLTSLLFERPGFMQDPAPNTVKNTLMAAHCACPTKLNGFNASNEPFLLRSHSESDIGVSMQTKWRLGQEVTIFDFKDPKSMYIGTGRVIGNI